MHRTSSNDPHIHECPHVECPRYDSCPLDYRAEDGCFSSAIDDAEARLAELIEHEKAAAR